MPPRPPKPPLTHFLCLPLVTESSRLQLERAFQHFRTRLTDASGGQLEPAKLGRAIRPVSTLHLTLGVMSLETPDRIEGASRLLEGLDLTSMLREAGQTTPNPSLLSARDGAPTPLSLSLTSLDSMKRGAKTSVLYVAPLDTTSRLAPFCEALRARFTEAGFLVDEGRELKLHATVLNTIYARTAGKGRAGSGKALQFDAQGVIDEFQNQVWAEEVRIERVAICKMGAEKLADEAGTVVDEKYVEIAGRDMPKSG